MDYTTGEQLRIFRNRSGLSQDKLAKMIGTNQVRISRLENDVGKPETEEAAKIETILNRKIWTLNGRENT